MPHRDTAFGRAVSKLKPPSSDQFSPADWKDAFTAHASGESDERLLRAAVWLAAESTAAAATFGAAHLRLLSPEWSTVLAVAAHNREYRTVVDLAREEGARTAADGMLFGDLAANLRVRGAAGQRVTAADLASIGADLTENWLFDALTATGTGVPAGDVAPIATEATQAYSFRKMVNTLWNQVWWDGWRFEDDDQGITRWSPGNPEFERLEMAWGMRQQSNLMSLPHLDMTAWPKLPPAARRRWSRMRGVTRIVGTGARQRFKVETLSHLSRRMPAYAIERAALEGVHLADFTGAPLPLVSNVTVDLLLLAWHVILDVAALLTKRAPLPEGPLTAEEARGLAMVVDRKMLQQAVADGLRVDEATADAIVTFLTFRFQTGGRAKAAGNKGLWAAPLVPLPGTNELALVLSVLATSNIVRRVETWLEKGGLDDRRVTTWPATSSRHSVDAPVPSTTESRGDRYETIVRDRLRHAIARNPLLTGARCAEKEIKKSGSFPEQIDLLVSFGGLCLVGEVKFFLMPADPHERDRYDQKLVDAADQAKKKLAALEKHPDVLGAALDIEVPSAKLLKLLPVIVTAQGYRFSTRIDGVLVIDANFLRVYLAGGEINTGMALDPATGRNVKQTTTLYSTQKAAAHNFETIMEAPYPLTRFLDQVKWGETILPTLWHPAAVLDATVVSGAVDSFENMQARAAADLLRGA